MADVPKPEELDKLQAYDLEITDLGLNITVTPEATKKLWEKILMVVKDFNNWLIFAETAKSLLAKGVINLDLISNELLFSFISHETDLMSDIRPRDDSGFAIRKREQVRES